MNVQELNNLISNGTGSTEAIRFHSLLIPYFQKKENIRDSYQTAKDLGYFTDITVGDLKSSEPKSFR